ncbi:DUF445 domain-containing protein [Aliikangiella coralliicola]|uniref:DUF445 domain-containing protein n=1 Tax=Aliikangiella coralliicola TaxID=2592383 RepID=A0A545UDI8_9GAMM|nr:DUF445 domain-containing protein [Aliikangiella coralliicola]TQV87532.1 DUF445 domain-containing protein [Aliikangiella coralliicola]
MNKSFITNFIAFCLVLVGYFLPQPILLTIGLFAFSGALTNWLAVHMLFEKVPGLYGSGVIPARFEEFKAAIKTMMMEQFFTDENIDKFLSGGEGVQPNLHLEPVIEKVDLSPAFDRLIEVIMQSSFGGMLGMFGGQEALTPLKDPFITSMKSSLIEMSHQPEFIELLKTEIEQPEVLSDIKSKVDSIIDKRLSELTPQLVKQIVQEMIKKHLGWLVVWGGVFGGIIGWLSTLLSF